jgi:hypothetical protein
MRTIRVFITRRRTFDADFKEEEQEMLIGRKSKYKFDRLDTKTNTVYLTLND